MVLWLAVTLIGIVLLTALIIALGTRSTARYQREQQSTVPNRPRQSREPAGATSA